MKLCTNTCPKTMSGKHIWIYGNNVGDAAVCKACGLYDDVPKKAESTIHAVSATLTKEHGVYPRFNYGIKT